MKKTIILVAAIVVSLGCFSSVFVFDPFKLGINFIGNLFNDKMELAKTANVVTEIKKISEFTTACFYEDKIIDRTRYKHFERKVNGGILSSAKNAALKLAGSIHDSAASEVLTVKDSTKTGRIIWIVKTNVRAGYDLSKVGEGDLLVSGDTLSIKLPDVEIFDILANPSDWELYHREGNWEDAEIREIQSQAKDIIREDAIAYGLLEKADSFGKESLVSLLKTFGFSEVILR
ncbi:MAG: DUF4230 domain-containing protein [Bacteroidales bacterium]|nr:DUF4230 domain-containing protein [Bacteroidales bacterium]